MVSDWGGVMFSVKLFADVNLNSIFLLRKTN